MCVCVCVCSFSVSDLRIVLLGKNESEISRVGNFIKGPTAFQSETPSYSQQHSVRISGEVEGRQITVINTHLLQPNISYQQITQGVRKCVSLSAPGPHAIVLVLQSKNFSENDRHRVITVLNLFSKQVIEHTIVLTSDEETRRFMNMPNVNINHAIHNLIKECGGRRLKFDSRNTGWRSELFKMIEEILMDKHDKFIICNMYEDGGDGSSVDEDLRRSRASVRGDDEEEEDSDLNDSTKTGRDVGGLLKSFCQDNTSKNMIINYFFVF